MLMGRSPDNKLLTPTMKLNRAEIALRYAREIAVSS
jgi:long-subunit acyl-CoA synthetase (AMP-forming)